MFKQDSFGTKEFHVKMYDLEMQVRSSLLGGFDVKLDKSWTKFKLEHSYDMVSVWIIL